MPIIYPEGGMPGLLLKQMRDVMPIDTFKVQLIPLRTAPKVKINGPEDVSRLVREMEDYDRESAKIIHLNTKNFVMGIETISVGSLSASIIHPRETVKGAVLNNSSSAIFVHNHPSGVCEPSNEDVHVTGILKEAFETVGITLLDSIIVGKGCHYSL
ncbi:MAG: JAB domain-containing protein, partial [Solirubrobacteraceae bacterium]|nr:JAB domain-containing protein [Solirubrobacteraceae bacterium]